MLRSAPTVILNAAQPSEESKASDLKPVAPYMNRSAPLVTSFAVLIASRRRNHCDMIDTGYGAGYNRATSYKLLTLRRR